ncbi:brassinosteroid-responsive RING protein 1 [Magnolia sinica]|uniref:brassinosteroid-responsive RING protein 1 n=1 Tax=Magnolia sinica TaxID=86752 RepID=UPI002658AA4B|nr:brassinosteroid-responsive RING protein 1 [Magnolia sinica]
MASGEYSGLVITHLFYKFSLLLALFRWIFSWAFRLMGLDPSDSSIDAYHQPIVAPSSSSSQTSVSAQAIRDSLHVATYGEVSDRQPNGDATCAVCLNKLRCHDKVWELRSCCHVFHKRCLDRWLDHDEHKTCPLCRAPLLGPSLPLESTETSWAVERLLYHFGDDLLFPSS